MPTANEIIARLELALHPTEGGYFRETYRSSDTISEDKLSGRYKGMRCFATAIYYLLTPDSFSAIHRLHSDEIFHFYLGDPVEMLQLSPDGTGRIVVLGSDLLKGMQPQVTVATGVWQGARLIKNGKFALLGTTVSLGFEFADYELGQRDELIKFYPKFRKWILALAK